MKWFLWFCAAGFVGSALAWMLPGAARPYHIWRWMDDYDSGIIEHRSEIGFGDKGLVKLKSIIQYSDGLPGALDKIRRDWFVHGSKSKDHWPVDTSKLQYNEWGPSRTTQADFVEVIQWGTIYLLPYSLLCLVFGAMLLIGIVLRLRKRRQIGILHKQPAG